MADPVWGQLTKAQDDEETIEEAVTRLIAAHEADAGAHTGSGESLETHKAQDIIDHPAGSILTDKETFTEVVSRSSFESLDSWSISDVAWVTVASYDAVLIAAEYGVEDTSHVRQSIQWSSGWTSWDKNWMIQFVAWSNYGTGVTFRGGFSGDAAQEGFGFEFLNGDVRGYVKDGASITYTSYLTIDHTDIHTYRAIYEPSEAEFQFFVDGVLKGTIEKTTEEPGEDMNVYFDVVANQAQDEINVFVKSLITSIEI